jgi:hypothetical protein
MSEILCLTLISVGWFRSLPEKSESCDWQTNGLSKRVNILEHIMVMCAIPLGVFKNRMTHFSAWIFMNNQCTYKNVLLLRAKYTDVTLRYGNFHV